MRLPLLPIGNPMTVTATKPLIVELRRLLVEAEKTGDRATADMLRERLSILADRATVDRGSHR